MNEPPTKIALGIAALGAVLSVVLMLASGLRPPLFLIFLFILWVSAPFAAVAVFGYIFSRRQRLGKALISTAILSTLSSIAVYTFVLIRPPVSQAAFPYVILPPLQVIATILITALLTRRPSKTGI
jgi:hypothetical protein